MIPAAKSAPFTKLLFVLFAGAQLPAVLDAQYSKSILFNSATASTMQGNIETGPNIRCQAGNPPIVEQFPAPFVFRGNDPGQDYLYQAYELYNNGPERCVYANIKWIHQDCDLALGAALYEGSFNPLDPTENLLMHTFDYGHGFFDFGPFRNDYYYTPGFYHAAGLEYHLDFVSVGALVPALSKVILVFDSLEQPGSIRTCPRDGSGILKAESNELTEKPLEVTVNNTSNYEFNSGMPKLTFYVSLSAKLAVPFSIDYNAFATGIGPGLAIAGTDFTAATDTITFQPGETLKLVEITILPDADLEGDETMGFQLLNPNPAGVTIVDGTVTGTIIDDDDPTATCHIAAPGGGDLPTGKVGDAYGPIDFVPGGPYVEYDWEVTDPQNLPDGVLFDTFVAGDTFDHGRLMGTPTESGMFVFNVHLTCSGLENLVDEVTVPFSFIVEPEDPPVIISLDNVTVIEGHVGTTDALPLITLSAALPYDLLLEVITADGDATEADNDYDPVPPAQLILIPANTTTEPIPLSVIGDYDLELDEVFTVELRTPIEQLFVGSATITIVNDDFEVLTVPAFGRAAGAVFGALLATVGWWYLRRRG